MCERAKANAECESGIEIHSGWSFKWPMVLNWLTQEKDTLWD